MSGVGALALDRKLQRALDKFEKARAAWHDAIREAQSRCKHEIWACRDGHSGTLFDHPSIQICTSCRAEVQTGTWSGWAKYEWRRPAFMRFAVSPREVGADDICRLRLRDDPRGFQTVSDLASAGEAGTAETRSGSVHEHATATGGDAQKVSGEQKDERK